MKIAVFGSAFNPPTRGHEDAIRYVFENDIDIEKVLLVPSFKHAFAKQMADYALRVKMVEAFVKDLKDQRVQAHAIEEQIATPQNPVFTFDLLAHIQAQLSDNDELCFVIGPDNAANWDNFYRSEEIKDRWQLITVPERKAIRSTLVREKLKQGLDVSGFLTPSVENILKDNVIYA